MFIVYYWSYSQLMQSEFLEKMRFDNYQAAKRFAKKVGGRVESRPVFA